MLNKDLKLRLARMMRDRIASMVGSYMTYMGDSYQGGGIYTDGSYGGFVSDGGESNIRNNNDNNRTPWALDHNRRLSSAGTMNGVRYVSRSCIRSYSDGSGTISTAIGMMKKMAISSTYTLFMGYGDHNARQQGTSRSEITEDLNPSLSTAPDKTQNVASINYDILEKFSAKVHSSHSGVNIQHNESRDILESIMNSNYNTMLQYPYDVTQAGQGPLDTGRRFEITSSDLKYDSGLPYVRYAGSTSYHINTAPTPYGVILSPPGVFHLQRNINPAAQWYRNPNVDKSALCLNYSTAMVAISRHDNMMTTPVAVISADRETIVNGPYVANKIYVGLGDSTVTPDMIGSLGINAPDTMQRGGYKPTSHIAVSADKVPDMHYGIEAIIKRQGPVGESRYYIGKKAIGFIEDYMSRYLPLHNPDGSESSYYTYKMQYGSKITVNGDSNRPYRREPVSFPMVHDGDEHIYFVSYDEDGRYWLNKYKIGYINSAIALFELEAPPNDMLYSDILYMVYSNKILTYDGTTKSQLPLDQSRFASIHAACILSNNSNQNLNGLYIAYNGSCVDTEFYQDGTGATIQVSGLYHYQSGRHYTDRNIFTKGYENPDSGTLFADSDNIVWMSNTRYISSDNTNLSEFVAAYYFRLGGYGYIPTDSTSSNCLKARYMKITYGDVSNSRAMFESMNFRHFGPIYGVSLRSNGDVVLMHESRKSFNSYNWYNTENKNIKVTISTIELLDKNYGNLIVKFDEKKDGESNMMTYWESDYTGNITTSKLAKVSDHKYCAIIMTDNFNSRLKEQDNNIAYDRFSYAEFFVDETELCVHRDPYRSAQGNYSNMGAGRDKLTYNDISTRNDPNRSELFFATEKMAISANDKNKQYVKGSFCVIKYKGTFAPIFAGEYIQTHGSIPHEWDYNQHKWVEAKAGVITTKKTHFTLDSVDEYMSIGFSNREYLENTTYLAECKGGSNEKYDIEISFGTSHTKEHTGIIVNGKISIPEEFSPTDNYHIEIVRFVVNGVYMSRSSDNIATEGSFSENEAMTFEVSNIYEGKKAYILYRIVD